jgi:hypothetical protein
LAVSSALSLAWKNGEREQQWMFVSVVLVASCGRLPSGKVPIISAAVVVEAGLMFCHFQGVQVCSCCSDCLE